jgi:hypothetical protein
MLTSFQKQKLKEMITALLPDYKYIRITKRGNVILKKSFWTFECRKYHFLELCVTILAPLVSSFQYGKPEVSAAYYLNIYPIMQSQETSRVVDYLFSEFCKWKSPLEKVSIEAYIERLAVNSPFIIMSTEHNDGEETPKLQLRLNFTKTIQTILLLILFFGTAAAF